jgi:hypothetical protein
MFCLRVDPNLYTELEKTGPKYCDCYWGYYFWLLTLVLTLNADIDIRVDSHTDYTEPETTILPFEITGETVGESRAGRMKEVRSWWTATEDNFRCWHWCSHRCWYPCLLENQRRLLSLLEKLQTPENLTRNPKGLMLQAWITFWKTWTFGKMSELWLKFLRLDAFISLFLILSLKLNVTFLLSFLIHFNYKKSVVPIRAGILNVFLVWKLSLLHLTFIFLLNICFQKYNKEIFKFQGLDLNLVCVVKTFSELWL